MPTIPQAVQQIKGSFARALPDALIQDTCDELALHYRDRVLNPVVTTSLFAQQILHGNVAIGELRRLSRQDFTDSAYCQARQRLPLALLERLQTTVTRGCRLAEGDAWWHGHRTYFLDGSSFSMPDTPALQQAFGQPSGQAEGCGFPTAHLLVLFSGRSGFLCKAVASRLRTHDLAGNAVLHEELQPDDVLVGDRAFCSYAHLALCRQRKLHGLFRAHQQLIIDFRPGRQHAPLRGTKPEQKGLPRSRWLKRLGKHDQLVVYHKPKDCPTWLSAADYAALPDTLVVREVRFKVREPGRRTRVVTIVTTLLDARRYTRRRLARLYELRWRVEVNLKHLKQTLKLDVLRCETEAGVRKELALFVLIYNLVCQVMQEAARKQGVAVERISFVDAWRWLRYARPDEEVPVLKVNPERRGRAEPRVRKRRPKQFPVMKKPRAVLRKALFSKRDAA